MTLEEAIKHAEEVAELNEWFEKECLESMQYKECAKEHRQLAEWLKDYKRLLEQNPCDDAINRQAVLDQTYLWSKDEFLRVTNPFDYLRKRINSLPSVNPTSNVSIQITEREKYGRFN